MGLDQLLNDTKASKTMGFLHAITKIQIHNYSFGRQASKIYLIFLSVLLSAPPVSNLLSAPPVSRNISCCVIRVSNISGNHKCVLAKNKHRKKYNRKHQKQEGAKIGTHSQEEPFLGGHKIGTQDYFFLFLCLLLIFFL